MKRAIVLSGGGAKGAYQLGFWKALRELDIDYDIVTGTSIGALNGALMVQGSYAKAYKLWYGMSYDMVLDKDMEKSFYTSEGKKEVILKYIKGVAKGGLNVPGLEKTIKDNLDTDLFFSSKVDYGLVTVKFPSLKPVMITKDKLTKESLPDYLLATAACFPAFKMKNIDDESYIDGGFYDNFPINLAIKMGATEIIAVNLKAIGNVKKIDDPSIPVTIIAPRNDIGNFLVMEKKQARLGIKYGYNDTMKVFGKLEGNIYTFKKDSLNRNYKRIGKHFYEICNKYLGIFASHGKYKKVLGKNKKNEFNHILENIAKAFEIDDSKIYRTSYLNVLIKRKFRISKKRSYSFIKKIISNNKFNKTFINKEIICYIYEEITNDKPSKLNIKNLMLVFPDNFLCAMYLKTLVG